MPYCHFESEALEIFAKTQQVNIYIYVLIFITMLHSLFSIKLGHQIAFYGV